MNLKINRGQTVAIVGQSGQGKSTMIQFGSAQSDFNMKMVYKNDKNEPK